MTTYQASAARRTGSRGDPKAEDWVEHLFIARTHDNLLFFTNGAALPAQGARDPAGGARGPGQGGRQLLAIKPEEQIAAVVPVREFADAVPHVRDPAGHGQEDALAAYGDVRR